MPSPGKIEVFSAPQGEGIRVDSEVKVQKQDILLFMTHDSEAGRSGATRDEAPPESEGASQACKSKESAPIFRCCRRLRDRPQFVAGKYNTRYFNQSQKITEEAITMKMITATMSGTVLQVLVKTGDRVKVGGGLWLSLNR